MRAPCALPSTRASRTRIRQRLHLTAGCVAFCVAIAAPWSAGAARPDFSVWLEGLGQEAVDRGISPATVESMLADAELVPRVIELDRRQPSKPADFCGYMERRLTPTRIARGRRMMQEHRDLLNEISAAYGVPPRYLVALWGLETNFGDYQGEYEVIDSLLTLAHDPRRSDLFREQVFAALQIVDEGHRPPDGFVGSWAGATGQVQFMPTTFLEYAVDHDGDGRKDLWSSVPDALASAANYLRIAGWRSGEAWGRQVALPAGLEAEAAALKSTRPVAHWSERGVRRIDGRALPASNLRGRIVLPKRSGGPAFLVYGNYHAFLAWNRSTFFAISVGALADEVSEGASPQFCRAPVRG